MVEVQIVTRSGRSHFVEMEEGEATRLVSKWQGLQNSDIILAVHNSTSKLLTFIHYRDIESISYPVEETNTTTAETGEKLILGDDGVIYIIDPDQVSLRPGITPGYTNTTTTHGHYDIHR